MPRVTEITVNAGRTFNHPYESYSNLRPSVTIKAELLEGEDWEAATKELQAKAESMVEEHKQHMLRSLKELHDLTVRQREVASLEDSIRGAQSRLDRLRKGLPVPVSYQQEMELKGSDDENEEPTNIDTDISF